MVKKHINTTSSVALEKDAKFACGSRELVSCAVLSEGSPGVGWVWLSTHRVPEAAATRRGVCTLCVPTQLESVGCSSLPSPSVSCG